MPALARQRCCKLRARHSGNQTRTYTASTLSGEQGMGSPDVEKGEQAPRQRLTRRRIAIHLSLLGLIIIFRTFLRDSFLEQFGWGAHAPTPKGPIKWEGCGKGFECGSIEAPLDYHNSTSGNVTLAVGRYLATSKDRLGSVYVNPGGTQNEHFGILLSHQTPLRIVQRLERP